MIENPIWNVKPFAYPAAFTLGTLGTLGRNTIDGPHLVWSQASASKQIGGAIAVSVSKITSLDDRHAECGKKTR